MVATRAAKILVVDDEVIICRSCMRILAEDGHDVQMAQTGEQALQMMDKRGYDVMLLDLRMPGFGGLRVLQLVRERFPQTQVVVFTGYPSIAYATESIRLGAFEFLAKPCKSQTLRALVSHALACKPWKILER